MKTVMQVVQHLSPGGIEVMALELKKCLHPESKVFIVSLEGCEVSMLNAWPRLSNIAEDIIFLNKQPGIRINLVTQLAKIFREHHASVVHTHHIGPLLYAGLAARIAGVAQLVHTEHDAWHLEQRKRRHLQRGILALTRPCLVADSRVVAQSMQAHLREPTVKVIPNGVDIQLFHPGDKLAAQARLNLRSDVVWVGSGGRLETVKGHHILLQALSQLPPHIHLVIAGNGSQMQPLREQVNKLQLTDRVRFLGRCDDMPTFYHALDVFCLPSLHEGMPLAPLEAQACGIPTVASDTGGSCETICATTGELVAPGDSSALAQALQRTLNRKCAHSPRQFISATANLLDMANAYAAQYNIKMEARYAR